MVSLNVADEAEDRERWAPPCRAWKSRSGTIRRIRSDTDVIGEIMVRGPNVMQGYYNLPEETSKTITREWLHTGDLGKMDAEGFVTITGRKKDLIISAGENIYPREIEEVLVQHPKVKEVAVIGVKDEVRGEVPKAFVIAREGMTVDEKELRQFCRENLAGYKVPKHIALVPDLPRTPTGKVLKRMLPTDPEALRSGIILSAHLDFIEAECIILFRFFERD